MYAPEVPRLRLRGITIADCMLAGEILLFVIAQGDLLTSKRLQWQTNPESPGAVPLVVRSG